LRASGVVDRIPPLEGVEAAIRDSRIRMCPICDAYEAIDRRIAVLGDGALAAREVEFLRTYSDDVTLLALKGSEVGRPNEIPTDLKHLSLVPDGVILAGPGAPEQNFDHLYLALGCAPQAALAVNCGAAQDETGNLIVNTHQMTSVEGLYAAGDVVRGLNQIAVATGEAAIAATDIHNRLRRAGQR
jgi:thioredoxin reductase (NADPH)